jgi:hypothetical protein
MAADGLTLEEALKLGAKAPASDEGMTLEEAMKAGATPPSYEDDAALRSASGNPFGVREQRATAKPKADPGFIERGLTSIGEGADHIGGVALALGGEAVEHATNWDKAREFDSSPGGQALHAAQRKELLRGVDDVVTLGHGQRLAARVGNALGDVEHGTSLDEGKHFSADPLQGNIPGRAPSEIQSREQAMAPDFRPAAQLVTSFATPSLLARVAGAGGNVVLRAAAQARPQLLAKALGFAERVGERVPAPVAGVAGYQAIGPASAALSADAEGHRGEAFTQTMFDPAGNMLAAGLPAVASGVKKGVLNSKGGKARQFIEERGGGARVGLRTPGSGGVFDQELRGLGTDDAATGAASAIGSQGIVRHLEGQHKAAHGYDYREGPDLVRTAGEDRVRTISEGERNAREAGRNAKDDIQAAQEEAPELIDEIAQRKQIEGSKPYQDLVEPIEASGAANNKRDFTHIVESWQKAAIDPNNSYEVRAKIHDALSLAEQYRDAPPAAPAGPPSPHLAGYLKARETATGPAAAALDKLIAAEMPAAAPGGSQGVRYMIPERDLNGFRRQFMSMAGIGKNDVSRGSDAPLRKAAFDLKTMTDAGPYASANELFHRAASEAETSRQALGLKPHPGTDTATEVKTLGNRLYSSIKDPTAFPGEIPQGADMSPFRGRIDAANESARSAADTARADKQAAIDSETATKARVAAGTEAAIPDRKLLRLNENIGQQRIDENQVGILLDRQIQPSYAAGRSNQLAPLSRFRDKHPSQGRNIDLPVLQNAKNDLAFRLKAKHGGLTAQAAGDIAPVAGVGLMATSHPIAAALLAASQNMAPIAGRVLYPGAKRLDPRAIARGLGRGRAADVASTLGHKVKAVIEAQKEQQP